MNLNPSQISLKNVIVAEGCIFRQDHWRKESGSALFGTNNAALTDPADAVIVALVDWHPTESVQRIVHLRGDGKVYFTNSNPGNTGDPGANAATTATGISGTGTRFGFFLAGGQDPSAPATRKLFLFRKNKRLCVVRGDTTDCVPISNPAVDWIAGGADAHPPITAVINSRRLVAAGNDNNPHQLYFSRSGNQEIFDDVDPTVTTNSQTASIFPGVGERIYALQNYQGFVVVFKFPRGIFAVDARDDDPANWVWVQVTDQIGVAPTPYAALRLENDVLFLGADAQFYLLSAVISGSRGETPMETANLGMDLEIYQFLLAAFNRAALNQIQSVYQPFWQTATFAAAGPSSAQNNARMLFDFNAVGRREGAPRFSYSYRDNAASLALHRDPSDQVDKPMYGDYLGNIILLEQDRRASWNGAGYPFRVQTPHSNLGEFENLEYASPGKFVSFANRNKLFDNLEIEYLPLTPATVTVKIYVDGVLKQTISAPLTFGGAALDAFILNTDSLGSGQVRSIVKRLNVGSGRRISVAFEESANDHDVAITHLYFGIRVGDTTQVPRV